MKWIFERNWASRCFGIFAGITWLVLVWFSLAAGLFFMLICAVGILFLFIEEAQTCLVGWNNSLEREKVSNEMLYQLVMEMVETDPKRALELAKQHAQLSSLVETKNFNDILDGEKGRKD